MTLGLFYFFAFVAIAGAIVAARSIVSDDLGKRHSTANEAFGIAVKINKALVPCYQPHVSIKNGRRSA